MSVFAVRESKGQIQSCFHNSVPDGQAGGPASHRDGNRGVGEM